MIDPYGLSWFSDFGDWELGVAKKSKEFFTGNPCDYHIDPNSLQYLSNQAGVGITPLTDQNGNQVDAADLALEVFATPLVSDNWRPRRIGEFGASEGELGTAGKLGELGTGKQLVTTVDTTMTGKNLVYRSLNASGDVNHVGITGNYERRAAEQLAEKGINIEPIFGLQNLSRADARAVEQVLIETHGIGTKGGTLLNKINSISPNNPIYQQSIQRGIELLRELNTQGFNMPNRVQIGDIIEIPTTKGLAYAQYTHQHPTHGGLIRVFDVLFENRPGNFTETRQQASALLDIFSFADRDKSRHFQRSRP